MALTMSKRQEKQRRRPAAPLPNPRQVELRGLSRDELAAELGEDFLAQLSGPNGPRAVNTATRLLRLAVVDSAVVDHLATTAPPDLRTARVFYELVDRVLAEAGLAR